MNKTVTEYSIFMIICSGLVFGFKNNPMDGSNIDPATLHLKVAYAVRISSPPVIDGDLSDSVWREGIPITDLLQVEPDNLMPPTKLTEVRILYDDKNLYVSFRNFDSEPDKIMRRLARRDMWMEAAANNADWVSIAFDSRNDNRTGYSFMVNAAGVELDAYIYNDDDYDISWNGVWDAKVKVDSLGWTVEYRIPFYLFWFSDELEQTWGLELNRAIYRKQEFHEWPAKKRGVEGIVSRFGILKGIKDIPTPHQFEILPYVLGGNRTGDKNELTRNIGFDTKYGLASNTTLNLTVNPDFGQVEADPSVLNLTAFETFFEENRIFFVEGGSFFKNRIQLFYSRRIGKKPGYFAPEDGDIVESPEATTILAAAKLMGRTASGIEFGVIESVTDREYGIWEHTVDGDTVREDILLEPYTNYFVGRVKTPVFNELSTVGFLATDIRRYKGMSASTAGLDWRFKLFDNRFSFAGQVTGSHSEKKYGSAGRFFLEYSDPVWWDLRIVGSWFDDSFEINELGFLNRNGTWSLGTFGGIRQQDPWGSFLRNDLRFRFFYRSRIDGLLLSKSLNIEQENIMKNYWAFGFGTEINFPSFSDDDTFIDNLAWDIRSPSSWSRWAWLRSDNRKRIVVNPIYGFGKDNLGGGGYMAKLVVTINPTDYLTFSVDATKSLYNNKVEWVGVESDTSGVQIVYSDSKQQINDIQLRMNWTFSPELSFQMWVQPFRVNMDYHHFKRLQAPRTLDFEPYDYVDDPDFKINNTVGTFVIRWEYLSGSTLFVVYNLNNFNFFSAEDDSWDRSNSNTLLIKLNYWFLI